MTTIPSGSDSIKPFCNLSVILDNLNHKLEKYHE
jgi:hypothetical protein